MLGLVRLVGRGPGRGHDVGGASDLLSLVERKEVDEEGNDEQKDASQMTDASHAADYRCYG